VLSRCKRVGAHRDGPDKPGPAGSLPHREPCITICSLPANAPGQAPTTYFSGPTIAPTVEAPAKRSSATDPQHLSRAANLQHASRRSSALLPAAPQRAPARVTPELTNGRPHGPAQLRRGHERDSAATQRPGRPRLNTCRSSALPRPIPAPSDRHPDEPQECSETIWAAPASSSHASGPSPHRP
jgi:hypothetical protein